MKRILLTAAAAIVAALVLTPAAWSFGTKDIVQMHRDGVPDSLIIQKIQYSGTIFHLGAGDMRYLREAGVPDEIISAMLATEAPPDRDKSYDGPYYRPYYWPYYPPYPYYYPYYPRVVVGFGFYGYHPHYAHRYYGYGHYGHRYYGHRHYGHGPHGGFAPGGHGTTRYR